MISALFRRAMLMLNEWTNYVMKMMMMMMMMMISYDIVVVRVEESLKADLFTDELNRKRRLSQTNKMKPPSKNTAAGSFVRLPACCFACGGGVVDAMVRWLDGGGAGFVFGGALKSSSWFRVDLSRRNSYHGASTTSSAGSCRHHLTLGDMGEMFCDKYLSLFYRWIWKVLLSPKLS